MVDVDIATATAVTVTITTAIFGALLWQRQKQRGSEKDTVKPTKWARVGTVGSLILYPVKSVTGIYMDSAIATPIGLQGRKGKFTLSQ